MSDSEQPEAPESAALRSDAWTDLGLTLPIFVVYHLGVVFLPVRNAADPVTGELKALANQSLPLYISLTTAIGGLFVLVLALIGRGQILRLHKFLFIGVEGVVYAMVMRVTGAWVIGALPLALGLGDGLFPSLVMSLGAGFYEELVFRVGLYGVGAWFIGTCTESTSWRIAVQLGWALATALAFSGWHHIGPMADHFELRVFAYRAACGLVLTAIYAYRGFAPAVWTHTLYDVWAMLG